MVVSLNWISRNARWESFLKLFCQRAEKGHLVALPALELFGEQLPKGLVMVGLNRYSTC